MSEERLDVAKQTAAGEHRAALLVLVFVIGVGALVRYPSLSRALYYDELCRAVAISASPFFESLISQQRASISAGFALVTRGVVAALGNNEFNLRLIPFIAGLLIPVLAFVLLRRLAGLCAALSASLIFCFSAPYVKHSVELKPYTLEALLVLILLVCVERIERQPSLRRLIELSVFGLIAALAATPVVFMFPPLFLYLIVKFKAPGFRAMRNRTLSAAGLLLVVSVVHYFLVLNPQLDAHLINQARAECPRGFGFGELCAFFGVRFYSILKGRVLFMGKGGVDAEIASAIVSFLLFVLGAAVLYRRGHRGVFVCGFGVIAVTLIMSFAGVWPFGTARPNLFLFPTFTVFAVTGLFAVCETTCLSKLRLLPVGLVIAIGVFLFPLSPLRRWYVSDERPRPVFLGEAKEASLYLRRELKPNDHVFIYHRLVVAAIQYYLLYYEGDGNEPSVRTSKDRLYFIDDTESAASIQMAMRGLFEKAQLEESFVCLVYTPAFSTKLFEREDWLAAYSGRLLGEREFRSIRIAKFE